MNKAKEISYTMTDELLDVLENKGLLEDLSDGEFGALSQSLRVVCQAYLEDTIQVVVNVGSLEATDGALTAFEQKLQQAHRFRRNDP